MLSMKPWRWALVAVAGTSAVLSGAMSACGDDSFTAAESTDGGDEGASSTDGGAAGDGGGGEAGKPGCLIVPTAIPPADVSFCDAFASVYDNCGSCELCRQSDVNNCAAYGDSFSASFKNAIVSCKDSLTNCDALQSQAFGDSPCLDDAMHAAAPGTAQDTVKSTYCVACGATATPDAGADTIPCDAFFFLPDGGATAATPLLYMGDAIVKDVQAACATVCSPGLFELCELNQLCNGKHAVPKTTCSQGLCK